MAAKLSIVVGNILDAQEDFICHQTNCVTTYALGLARDLFERYPHADTYRGRTKRTQPAPGTIDIMRGPKNIINLNAQVYPGCVGKSQDHTVDRHGYFRACLMRIHEEAPEGSSFAFPHGIGCGFAGGDWKAYSAMIEKFSSYPRVRQVVVYSLE